MQTFSRLFLAAILLLSAVVSFAQVDSDPDGIGIYFDVGATVNSATGAAGEFVPAYLIGTHLSQSGHIDYWEAHLYPGPGAMVSGTPYGSYNFAMNMPGDPNWHCVALSPEPPLPAQEITLLASLHVQIWDDSIPTGVFLSGEERYRIEGSLEEFSLYPSSGSPDLPVATINGEAPVSLETGTWGTIKSMFR